MHHQYRLRIHSLINSYNVLNQCLELIKKCKIKSNTKLIIESQLIRMKRLLLDERVARMSWEDDLFEGLLLQMKKISGGIWNEETVEDFLQRLRSILAALGEESYSH